jgi:hypothetical protein
MKTLSSQALARRIPARRTAGAAAAVAAALSSFAGAADPTPPASPAPIPVAHSALLTIDATPTDQGLALHIKHAGNQIPIDGRDVTVSVDGKNAPVAAEPEGTFLLATKDLGDGDAPREFDITVAHDGIREILTGKVTLPKTGGAADMLSSHKQIAWWILNIAIVLIAAMAFSKRGSKTPEKEAGEDD